MIIIKHKNCFFFFIESLKKLIHRLLNFFLPVLYLHPKEEHHEYNSVNRNTLLDITNRGVAEK